VCELGAVFSFNLLALLALLVALWALSLLVVLAFLSNRGSRTEVLQDRRPRDRRPRTEDLRLVTSLQKKFKTRIRILKFYKFLHKICIRLEEFSGS
jgi:hypothetical protein